jgi:DNA polymerase-3 subunit epsilon
MKDADWKIRASVDAVRARLAELESAYTIEKAKVDGLQARLFSRLRQHHQERERLRLIVSYRRQFLDTLLRQGEEETEHLQREYHEARARIDREYEETAAAMAAKKELTGEEEVELAKLWKTLVKLYHPDRFAHEPDKLETYSKLTAAINRAKDSGDLDTLQQIASDPHGFILRQGWSSLDFREEEHAARLGKLLDSLEMEILSVLEATNQLRASPEFELFELTAKNAEMFDAVVSKQTALLEKEIIDLTNEADQLSKEIGKLTTQAQPGEE